MISTKYNETFVTILLILFLVFNFVDRTYSNLSLIFLLLLSVIFSLSKRNTLEGKSIRDIFVPFIQLFVLITIAHIYHSADISELDNYSRLILLLPIYLLLSSIKFNKDRFIKIIIYLSIFSLISSFIYYLSLEKVTFSERINGDFPNRLNPVSSTAITYGNLCMTLFILNICAFVSKNRIKRKFIYIGLLSSLLSWSLSMTVGSIVGLGIFLAFLLYKGLIKFSIKNTFIVFSLLLVVSLTPLSNKFQLYIVNISELIQQDNIYSSNMDNSIKERVFFLNTSLNIISNNKYTGVGFNKFEEIVKNKSRERNIIIEARDHPHNDFLDLGVKMGLAGIISLLAFYLLLYNFFRKRLDRNKSYFCISGVSVLTSQFGYMMTQTQFTHHQAVVFFIVLLLFFASQSKLLEN